MKHKEENQITELLMTYGWAILAAIFVIAFLGFYFHQGESTEYELSEDKCLGVREELINEVIKSAMQYRPQGSNSTISFWNATHVAYFYSWEVIEINQNNTFEVKQSEN